MGKDKWDGQTQGEEESEKKRKKGGLGERKRFGEEETHTSYGPSSHPIRGVRGENG